MAHHLPPLCPTWIQYQWLDRSRTILTLLLLGRCYLCYSQHLRKRSANGQNWPKNAFRLIPVRPEDGNLLGICWKKQYYIDTCLPFGLRSAPSLFNQLSTAIHWILQHRYHVRHFLHYLDDVFTVGSPDSEECSNNLKTVLSLCKHINAPVKSSKIEGPSTRLSFLGIILTQQICKQAYQKIASKICYHYYCPLTLATNAQNSNFFHS